MKRASVVLMLGTVVAVGILMAQLWNTPAPRPEPVNTLVAFEQAALAAGGDVSEQTVEELRRAAGLGANGKHAVATCFAPGTPIEIVQAFYQAMYGGDLDYYIYNRWSGGSAGSPITLRWSLAPDGLSIPGNNGEPTSPNVLFASMDSVLGREVWVGRFQQAFDRWSAISGVTYTRIMYNGNDWDDGAYWGAAGSANRGDCRIGMHYIDGSSNVLAYNFFPDNGDMVLDSADLTSWGSPSDENLFLRNVVAHEHGHGLGIAHVCPPNGTKLMEPYIYTGYDGPRHDDFRAVQRSYGDHFGANNSAASAADLGTLSDPQSIGPCTAPMPVTGGNDTEVSICSIDTTNEQDYFKFTIAGCGTSCGKVTVVASPRGKTYENQPQAGNGDCPSGNAINSKAVGDLVLAVLDTNGTTVLAEANNNPAGSPETLSDVALPGPGTFYVRIKANGTVASTQLYDFSINYTCRPVLNGQPVTHVACVGTSTTFRVYSSGTIVHQWYKQDDPNDPNGWTALTNDGHYSGVSTSLLTINPVAKPDAGAYRVVMTNACGDRTSDAATLWLGGDCNCDGIIDFDDVNAFVLLLQGGCNAYHQVYPDCDCLSGDCNCDGVVNFNDINPFVGVLGG